MANEAPAAAPSAPAAAAPAQQAPATVTPIRPPHHSDTQPREVGKFAGAPVPPAPAPKSWKVGERTITDPDELYHYVQERQVDERAFQEARAETERLRQENARWQNPAKALTAEQRQSIALQELKDYARAEEEAKLPPEQRAFLQRQRELEEKVQEYENEKQTRAESEQQAAALQQRNEAVDYIKVALSHMGDTKGDTRLAREVLFEARAALAAGKQYPPEVLARRVQKRMERETEASLARVPVQRLIQQPAFLASLNALEDPTVLAQLAPLLERVRLQTLKGLGAVPAPQRGTTSAPVSALPVGQTPRTTSEWVAYFQGGGARTTPEQIRTWNDLKDRRLL